MRLVFFALMAIAGLAGFGMETFHKGMTISCQGYGRVWGSDLFAEELDRLKALGVNSVTIHPYGRIHEDGSVTWRDWRPGDPPQYLSRPIREAHARGLRIMIKPHLAYWGTSFSWRGEIQFESPEAQSRFFTTYQAWITALAEISKDADMFVVGAELKGMLHDEAAWRKIIAAVREVTDAPLTYAANWDVLEKVPFWDALDYIGVQAYFPITNRVNPSKQDLLEGWEPVIANLRSLHERTNLPVIWTEFGYNQSMIAAAKPWDYHQDSHDEAAAIQARCLKVGLEVMMREKSWLHGAFLWKWFAGPAPRANFRLDTPTIRALISAAWRS